MISMSHEAGGRSGSEARVHTSGRTGALWTVIVVVLGLGAAACGAEVAETPVQRAGTTYPPEWDVAQLLPQADAWAAQRGGNHPVVEAQDFALSREELIDLYDRQHPLVPYAHASQEERVTFLETWVEKELLVLAAREAIGEFPHALHRRIRVEGEQALLEMHTDVTRAQWEPDSLVLGEHILRVSREADIDRITIASRERAEACWAALEAGLTFEEAHAQYSETGEAHLMPMGWRSAVGVPPRVARVVFYDDLPPGVHSRVISTARGNWIVRVKAYRPLDLTEHGPQGVQIRKMAEKVLQRDALTARSDSMQTALRLRVHHPEAALASIGEAVSAYVDSMSAVAVAEGAAFQWPMRVPTWRVDPNVMDAVVYELEGRSYTARDLLRRLDLLDLEVWPRSADSLAIRRSVEHLAGRHAIAADARNLGLLESPFFLRRLRSIRDEACFDWYRETLEATVKISRVEADSVYRSLAPWTFPERYAAAVVVFGEDDLDLAEAFSRDMQGTDRRRWREASLAAQAGLEEVTLLDNLEPFTVGMAPPSEELVPLQEAAFRLPVDGVSSVIPLGGRWAVLRVYSLIPEREMPEPQAREMAAREIRLARLDAMVQADLERVRAEQKVQVHRDRM